MSAGPKTTIRVGAGVVLELEHDPRGFFGDNACLCGHAEEKHVYSHTSHRYACARCNCAVFRGRSAAAAIAAVEEEQLTPRRPQLPARERPAFARRTGEPCNACSGTGTAPARADEYDAGLFGGPCRACGGRGTT